MPSKAGGRACPARTWLLGACAFGFAVILWDLFATPHYDGAFGADFDGGPSVFTVSYVVPGRGTANAGLRLGDKVEFARTAACRKGVVGIPCRARVQRAGNVFYTSVVPVEVPPNAVEWLNNLANGWPIAFATIVAWFGAGRRARLISWLLLSWGLSGTGLGVGPGGFVTAWPWVNEVAYLFVNVVNAMPSILLAIVSSTFGRPISPFRRTLEWSTYVVAALGSAVGLLFELIAITPWFDKFWPLVAFNFRFNIGSVAGLLASACAFTALAAVRGEERQRAAWVLTPIGVLFLVTALFGAAGGFAGGWYGGVQQPLTIGYDVVAFTLLGLISYAVLSRRLLDVEFVINRAAVFAGVSLVVVSVFILTELLFNRFFTGASRSTSAIVTISVALAVGISLQYIHRYVDRLVDLVFFRARHEHERALREFAHEAAFITDADTLLDNAVHEVVVNGETDRVSILLRDECGSYTTARATNGAIETVSENDRGILKLRAWHTPVDLKDIDTALVGTRACPLTSRGDLLGILVCGEKRDGQGYAPDESEALLMVARSVGSALHGLGGGPQDDLKAAIDEVGHDLRIGMVEIRDALRDLNPPTHRGAAF